MVWDWAKINPLNESILPFSGFVESLANVIETVSSVVNNAGTAQKSSATSIPLPDESARLIFTDPPYYDSVPYANLSDFFYVWLKRTIGKEYPDYFCESGSPKDTEIVQLAERNVAYAHKTKQFFESEMEKALSDSRRVVETSGIGCIVFAHKSTAGWETLLNAVLRAGWIVTASWPIDTEMTTRFKAINTASLESSIHLVCRRREIDAAGIGSVSVGDWRDVLTELPKRIHEWMPRLAAEQIVGADAIFACLGPALEIFSRYSRVEKAERRASNTQRILGIRLGCGFKRSP